MTPLGAYDGVVEGPRLFRWLVRRVWRGKVFNQGYTVWNIVFGRQMILGHVYADSNRGFTIRYAGGLTDTLAVKRVENDVITALDGKMVLFGTFVIYFTLTLKEEDHV